MIRDDWSTNFRKEGMPTVLIEDWRELNLLDPDKFRVTDLGFSMLSQTWWEKQIRKAL
jgi:hypothetical protein